jgi:hypothetical protein
MLLSRKKIEKNVPIREVSRCAVVCRSGRLSDSHEWRYSGHTALFGPDLETCPFRNLEDLLIFQSDHRPEVAFFVFLYSQFSRSAPQNAATGIGRTCVLSVQIEI